MLIQLLLPVTLFALGAALCFEKKIHAVITVTWLFGIGYFLWGAVRAQGVTAELVSDADMNKIWSGLALVTLGIIMATVEWFLRVRAENPLR